MAAASTPRTDPRPLVLLACLLTATSGTADALTYFHLGGAFSSAMTGNVALLGISLGGIKSGLFIRVLIAIAAYCVGIAVATLLTRRIADRTQAWPRQATQALGLATIPLALAAVMLLVDGSPERAAQLPVLALLALAMGIQSGAYRYVRIPDVLGTTYVSGNVVVLVQSLVHGPIAWRGLLSLLAIAAGAGAETGLVRWQPRLSGLLPLIGLVTVLAIVAYTTRTPAGTDASRMQQGA